MKNPTDLHDRICNAMAATNFESDLEKEGTTLIVFQLGWSKVKTFEALPPAVKKAILAAERELAYAGPFELQVDQGIAS